LTEFSVITVNVINIFRKSPPKKNKIKKKKKALETSRHCKSGASSVAMDGHAYTSFQTSRKIRERQTEVAANKATVMKQVEKRKKNKKHETFIK
jgi:hypothetical protein